MTVTSPDAEKTAFQLADDALRQQLTRHLTGVKPLSVRDLTAIHAELSKNQMLADNVKSMISRQYAFLYDFASRLYPDAGFEFRSDESPEFQLILRFLREFLDALLVELRMGPAAMQAAYDALNRADREHP